MSVELTPLTLTKSAPAATDTFRNRSYAGPMNLQVVSQSPAPSDPDWAWRDEHRERAFDALMPIVPAPGQLVAYRRYRDVDQDVPEAHFAIGIGERPASGSANLREVVTTNAPRFVPG